MRLKVFNTLTRQKEDFVPVEPGKVKIYVCGVTPYNHPHIGNARPYLTWDVIRRYLEHRGFEVVHVQNFTDVDDKIINTANSEGVSWDVIAKRYIEGYFEVMDKLHIRRAHIYPKVSEHIREILDMVSGLVERGYAYVAENGDVYYKVEQFEGYGKLSGRTLDDMQAGARVEVNESKIHPMDFALWKAAKPGEPAWESPWGPGRPGWHIECSAMSYKYLGETFDFHGGGSDLVFPHHENEVAQSEAFTGAAPFVKYWLHNGFITVNQEKMSKSLGNFFLVKDILEHYPADVLRFLVMSTHYRSPFDFGEDRMEEASRGLERLRNAVENILHLERHLTDDSATAKDEAFIDEAARCMEEFYGAMDDDFNTALAIGSMFGLAKEINVYYNEIMGGKASGSLEAVRRVKEVYFAMAEIIGILDEERRGINNADSQMVDGLMELIISIRQEARKKKDWATADQIRDQLGALNIVLEDSPQGVRWKKK